MREEQEDDIKSYEPQRALVGTDAGRNRQFRETAKPGSVNNYSWSAEVGVPKAIWVSYVLIADTRRNTGKLTLEELNAHPDTAHLSLSMKRQMVKFWGKYEQIKEQAYEIRDFRADVVDKVIEVSSKAKAVAKKAGLSKTLEPHEEYDLLSRAAADKSQEAQLVAFAITRKEREEDPIKRAIHDEAIKDAFNYGKLWKLNRDISDRFVQSSGSGIKGVSIDSETAKKMAQVKSMLSQRGIDLVEDDGEA